MKNQGQAQGGIYWAFRKIKGLNDAKGNNGDS